MSYKIKSRIWIEHKNHVVIGEGRVQLLKAIEKTGSLSKAAKSLKMSYKKAWTSLNAINKSAKKPVVTTNVGGKNGGGAELTEYGKFLITEFDKINKKCWDFLDTQLEEINKL